MTPVPASTASQPPTGAHADLEPSDEAHVANAAEAAAPAAREGGDAVPAAAFRDAADGTSSNSGDDLGAAECEMARVVMTPAETARIAQLERSVRSHSFIACEHSLTHSRRHAS